MSDLQDRSDNFALITDKVTFLPKILTMLSKATVDDEQPTPGYLYREINALTFESGSYCMDLLNYLVGRLDKPSYHVKIKVLRIMLFLIENGHPHFKQGLRKFNKGIHEACNYSGPPDPLHGNTPYVLVRNSAQNLAQILFDVKADDSIVPKTSQRVTQQGMGAINHSTGKMEGFGNTEMPNESSIGDTLVSGLKEIAEKFSDTEAVQRREHAVSILSTNKHVGQYQPVKIQSDLSNSNEFEIRSSTEQQRSRKKNVVHRVGVAGGGWGDDEEFVDGSQTHSSTDNENIRISPEDSIEDCIAEKQLLQSIMDNSDADKLITLSALRKFTDSCSTLNCERLVEQLNMKLNDNSEHHIMDLLLCLEALIRSDLINVDLLSTMCAESLLNKYKHADGPVKSKARKIIRILQKLVTNTSIFEDELSCPNLTSAVVDTSVTDTADTSS